MPVPAKLPSFVQCNAGGGRVNSTASGTARFKTTTKLVAAILVLVIAAGLGVYWARARPERNQLVLYGNVDLRQVDLAFNNSERLVEVSVREGDRVAKGQILARLDTSRLTREVQQAAAEVQSQQALVLRLHNGSRPQEIAQAEANVAAAKADLVNAEQEWRRLTAIAGLTVGKAVSQQDLDAAQAALDMAKARLNVAENALILARIGPRLEDVAAGEAQLRADQAQLDLQRQRLADAELPAPCDAVVRTRLLEPGEMVTPQRPVYTLAIVDPKWVRAYATETDLGKIRPGMKAAVSADGFPGRTFSGWVGFVSSVAEFTPKPVETVELRSSLVYEIRVFIEDAKDEMRLGMPATVTLAVGQAAAGAQ
jgi:HlyD family secretion protein